MVDNQGEKEHFVEMDQYLRLLNNPVLYVVGNHETRYQSKFEPGYNMDAFNHYFAAQKAMNGLELLLYSFNLGGWHFVVWPDPLRKNFWETHPHYFDWLEKDLEAHKHLPVMFFQHVPAHPIGIEPLINYAETVAVRKTLLDVLKQYRNVRYVLSGHVHIPIKASFKTAVEIEGICFINLPAAGYRPRAFGEQDWNGGPSQGALVADFEGSNVYLFFKTVTEEEYPYPAHLPRFDQEKYALWFTQKWDLPAQSNFVNGSFEEGLKGWAQRFVYQEDEAPSNRCEVHQVNRPDSASALYLYSRRRGYQAPGQDRLPQSINRICQAVSIGPDWNGTLSFAYKVDGSQTDFSGFTGAFVWVEGFQRSFRLLNQAYWLGKAYVSMGESANDLRDVIFDHFQMPQNPDQWHQAHLCIRQDYLQKNPGKSFQALKLDRLVINVGTWHVNDGPENPFAIWFDAFALNPGATTTESRVGDLALSSPTDSQIWHLNKHEKFVHIAGEHRYIMATKSQGKWEREK